METLYRKYRPIDFDTVVGQDAVVRTLKNQIEKGSIAHAYLFSGTRGTGKTTIAKIFARSINCPNEKGGNPCNECATCKSAIDGSNLNIVEMDAASNRGVEDIRRISEEIAYPPMNEKYKVYIIDEVHALTKEASQAFLKILEEPPEYVVYILATTDPNKLPETILSRCQKYNFKRINIETTVKYLMKICISEKIEVDEDALIFIAEKSDGSMRESISKLDRCRAYAVNEKLTKELVSDILGIVDDTNLQDLVYAVNIGNINKAFSIVSECIEKGKDLIQLTNDFIWHLRNLLIVKDLKEPVETLNITVSNFYNLKKASEEISKDVLIYYIEELSRTANLMKYDDNRRVIFETTLIRLANPRTNYIEQAVMARISDIEEKIVKGSFIQVERRVVEKEDNLNQNSIDNENEEKSNIENDIEKNAQKNTEKKIQKIELSELTYEEMNKVKENWKAIISGLNKIGKAILESAKVVPSNENATGFVEVLLSKNDYYWIDKDDELKKIEEKLEDVTKKLLAKDIIYRIECIDDTNFSENVSWELDEKLKKAQEKISMEIGIEDE